MTPPPPSPAMRSRQAVGATNAAAEPETLIAAALRRDGTQADRDKRLLGRAARAERSTHEMMQMQTGIKHDEKAAACVAVVAVNQNLPKDSFSAECL